METIYLDTHVIVWLYYGFVEKLSTESKKQINNNVLLISPMVLLELQYLLEINRISHTSSKIYETLNKEIGLLVCDLEFAGVIDNAISLSFTKDPFDRIIVAQANTNNRKLITKDKLIRDNYKQAIW